MVLCYISDRSGETFDYYLADRSGEKKMAGLSKEEKEEIYDAFISYRHEPLDSYVAEQLHKMLEHYRIPRQIREISGKNKISRIFRDKEELALSPALNDNIKQALRNSEYLIVVCSPAASKSEWISREIEYFSLYHSPEHILLVLADGEPAESFPELFGCLAEESSDSYPGIYPIGPLAADVRGSTRKEIHKKLKQELLRLLAPMLSCKYDELRMRHREYRKKRILAAAAGFVIVIALTAAFMSFQSARIEQQRKSASEAQARYLCKTSEELLAAGDREGAIKAAASLFFEKDGERQAYVPEQFYALNNALYSYQAPQSYLDEFCVYKYYPVKKVTLEHTSSLEGSVNPENTIYMNFRRTDAEETVFFMDTEFKKVYWEISASDLTGISSSRFKEGHLLSERKAVVSVGNSLFYLDIADKEIMYRIDLKGCLKYEAGSRYVVAVYGTKDGYYARIFDLESDIQGEKTQLLIKCELDKDQLDELKTSNNILIVQDESKGHFFLSGTCESESTVESTIIEYSIKQKKIVNEISVDSIVYDMIPDNSSHLAILEHHLTDDVKESYFDILDQSVYESFLSIYDMQENQWVSRMEHSLTYGSDYGRYWYSDYYGLRFWDSICIYNYLEEPDNPDNWEKTRSAFVAWVDGCMMFVDPESGKILEEYSGTSNYVGVDQLDDEKILLCCEDGSVSCRNLNGYAHEYRVFWLNSVQIETDWSCYCPRTGTVIQHPKEGNDGTLIIYSQLSDDGYIPINIPNLRSIDYMTLYTEEKTVVCRVGCIQDSISNEITYIIWDDVPSDENMLCSNAEDFQIKKYKGKLCLCYSEADENSLIHVVDLETHKEVACSQREELQLTEDDSFYVVYDESDEFSPCYTPLEDKVYAAKRPLVMIPMEDQTIQIVDQDTNETILTIPVSDVSFIRAAFFRDDSLLILADRGNQTISLWDLELKERVSQIPCDMHVEKIMTSAGSYFAVSSDSHTYNQNQIFYVDESNQIFNYADVECNMLNLDAQEIICDSGYYVTGYCHFHSFEELLQKAEKVLGEGALTSEEK